MGARNSEYTPNETELAYIRKSYENCQAFVSICGGIFDSILAGILEGKTCTGPRLGLQMFRDQCPGANWVEKRWVRDGKMWTSGALLNGSDLMSNFVKHYWGKGDDTLVDFLLELGAWPNREISYKDVDQVSVQA